MISSFFGVVENINDPLMLGRIQVRVIGHHSSLKVRSEAIGEGIPTEDLPWAMPLQSISSAGVSGIGISPTGIVQGSWVFGVSRDGELFNDLIIIGTLGGQPTEKANTNVGFNDPDGVYPLEALLNEPDINRLARGETSDTVVEDKNSAREMGITTISTSWDEPASPYNAAYPYNMVFQSRSGHVIEVDDTAGSERIHEYHKSGTYREINAAGDRVTKVIGDDYEIVVKDKKAYVKGNISITVDGDAEIYTKGTSKIKSDEMIEMEAPAIRIKGPVTQTGGDMTSDGISAQHHTHPGVKTGPSNTGEPN